MKTFISEIASFLVQPEVRQNLRGLLSYLALLVGAVLLSSVLFHVLMIYEGQEHSWITGLYWTLTVMSTLGFGDITFQSDLGRIFSILVLVTGVVLLLIMLPFVFIRLLYAPWLEAQLRVRAPREAPQDVDRHVILCCYDEVAASLVPKLQALGVPHHVIEPDEEVAARLHTEGVPVVAGTVDSVATYEALRAERAALVVANSTDAQNAGIALTVRERFPDVRIAAFANEIDSVDILELSGANHVLPLRHRLGQYLASRVNVGPPHADLVGRFKDLRISEFPVERTGLVGRTIRDTRLRELTGLHIVACWERGKLIPARPDTVLTDHSIAVVVGTPDQLAELDALFVIYNPGDTPVIVIGGGKVGQAAARALRRRNVPVNLVERDPALRPVLESIADSVVIGDASALEIIMKAGLEDTPCVVLTTNDDAMNMFLAVYCRRLNPQARILSRITHERNLEAIYRAGVDSALSDTTLGVKSVLGLVLGTEATFVGEGVDLLVETVPRGLVGRRLADSGIAEKTGLHVVAIEQPDGSVLNANADAVLGENASLAMVGTLDQREAFREAFEG